MVLSLNNIQKSFGDETILNDITFLLEDKEKAAIVGVNGAGKTTVLKIIAGEFHQDGGEIFLAKNNNIGYLSQSMNIQSENGLYEEMLTVFQNLIDIENEMRKSELLMSALDGKELEEQIDLYDRLSHTYETQDGYMYKSLVKGVIKGLGFTEEEFDKKINTLSGGQKTRVCLGKLLLAKPQLLLLDEPTNHLDIDAVNWLEDYLKDFPGAVLIVSHDRYFIDRIVTKVIEIENKKATVYGGNYTEYAHKKEEAREIKLKQFFDNQKIIKHHEEFIARQKAIASKKSVKRAASREKFLEKIEKVDKPDSIPDKMRLILTPTRQSGSDVIHAESLAKEFGDKLIFDNISFDIKKEEKVAIIGPNGIGKTTLMRILLGQEKQTDGKFYLGTNVKIGYYDQEQIFEAPDKSIFQEISDAYPTLTNGEIRNILAAFVFTGDDVFQTIKTLSGGEKGRVALAKLMLSDANVLILDEPTNHLDIFSKEVLESAIINYGGTVLYISHDRYFINRTCTRILEFTANEMKNILGNYSYYMEKKTESQLLKRLAEAENPKPLNPTESNQATPAKSDWLKKKTDLSNERKKQTYITKLEKEIESIEEKINETEHLMAQPEIYSDYEKANEVFLQKKELGELLEELYSKWEEISI